MEKQTKMFGIAGRMEWNVCPGWAPGTFTNQKFYTCRRPVKGYGNGAEIRAEIRFDDNCKNGHNTFAITGTVTEQGREVAGGCLHEDIAKAFPELAHLIKWHLVASDGPLHYVANTLHLAGDRDCHGLLKGERRQIIGRNGPCWKLHVQAPDGTLQPLHTLPSSAYEECPAEAPTLVWAPWCRIGEGKARDLAGARSAAVWPEASDEQLCAEPAELEAALRLRLPMLMAFFRNDMEAAGFRWSPTPADHV